MSGAGRLVCVFGVSGVGKTTLIGQFVRAHADWHALSAGQLLAQLSSKDPAELRLADRPHIESNQARLAAAIAAERRAHPHRKWLLDAHSVIDNDRELVPVPTATIEHLRPDLLIFLFDDSGEIRRRRAEDSRRRRPVPSIERLEEEQDLAWRTCLGYAHDLQLPLRRVSVGEPAQFEAAIGEFDLSDRRSQ